MSWLLALDAGSCVFHRAHGLDDYLVWVGGPEAMALVLVTMASRSLTSSTSLFGAFVVDAPHRHPSCNDSIALVLGAGGGGAGVS
jgi:hypothetical protein